MPMIDVARFNAEAAKVNKNLGRFVKSSLDPIMKELGAGPKLTADPVRMERLQDLIFHLPHDSQTKYQSALAVLQQAGLNICGRPCDPQMEFVRFDQGDFMYVGLEHSGQTKLVNLAPGCYSYVLMPMSLDG